MTSDLRDLLQTTAEAKRRHFGLEDFASDYGRSVVGRVKRRRVVSATALGGGTVAAVGVLAFGAPNVPWGSLVMGASPAETPSTVCTTATPDAVAGPVVDVPPGAQLAFVDNTDGDVAFAGMVDGVATVWHGDAAPLTSVDRQPVIMTFSSGQSFEVTSVGDGVGGAPWHRSEISVMAVKDYVDLATSSVNAIAEDGTVLGKAARASTALGPTPTPVPTEVVTCVDATPSLTASEVPSPQVSPSATATSPFQCGYEFDAPSHDSPGLALDDLRWLTAEDAEQAILAQNGEWPEDLPHVTGPVFSASVATADDLPGSGQRNVQDPRDALPTVPTVPGINFYMGLTFVGVADGEVTATIPFDPVELPGLYMGDLPESTMFGISLLDADEALKPCSGLPAWDEIYVVSGIGNADVNGWVREPVYSWAQVPEVP